MRRPLMRLVPIVLVMAGVVGYKLYEKNNASGAVRDEARALVQGLPGYVENKAYFEAEFEKHHDAAFEQAYKVGGRRQSSAFDKKTYEACLIAFIQRDAAIDGHENLVPPLESHRKQLGLPKVEF